jgi:DNA-binding XRE family transcriptional regulator
MTIEPNRRTRIRQSPADRARHQAIREQFRDQPGLSDLLASGEIDRATFDRASEQRAQGPPCAEPAMLVELGMALREERERLGLSLAEVAERCGIDAPALSRLENGQNPNPTLATLMRYARAIGKRIHWRLEDQTATVG